MAFEDVFLILGLFFGIVGTVCTYVFYGVIIKFMYPIRAPIAIQRENSVVWDFDERAKYMKGKSGYEILKLRKRKDRLKPPKFGHVTIQKNGKPAYPLFNSAMGQYFPIKFTKANDKINMEVVEDTSAKNWSILERRRIQDTYTEKEGFFAKYAPFIMNVTFAAMVIFFVIYFGGKMEMVSNAMGGAASSLEKALGVFGGNVATPPPTAPIIP